jgi:hypothetical protein
VDARPPLSQLVLPATSVADDLGFVALADMATAAAGREYRLIGGHMLTMLVARWQLGAGLYRETLDTDLGIPPTVAADPAVVDNLLALHYEQTAGDRFERKVSDLAQAVPDREATAAIDVLVPSYTSRARQNRRHGDRLIVTEALGLATALQRPAIEMSVVMRRLDGEILKAELLVPDEVSALTLKAFATTARNRPTDIVDIWRCLEVAYAAGSGPGELDAGEPLEAASIVRSLFRNRRGDGIRALTDQLQLSTAGADARFTRLRALIDRVLGPNETT